MGGGGGGFTLSFAVDHQEVESSRIEHNLGTKVYTFILNYNGNLIAIQTASRMAQQWKTQLLSQILQHGMVMQRVSTERGTPGERGSPETTPRSAPVDIICEFAIPQKHID